MKFMPALSIALLLIGKPGNAQSVVALPPPADSSREAALERHLAMAALAARLAAQQNAQEDAPQKAGWLMVEREWAGAVAAALPSRPSSVSDQNSRSNSASRDQGNASAMRVGSGSGDQTTVAGAAGRAAIKPPTISVGSRGRTFGGGGGGGGLRTGTTTINARVDNVSTTANRGDASTNIGTREGGSGSARIDVRADNVITDAAGGDAATNIGARSGNGTSQVVAGTTITRARGGSATTNIGNGDGFVSTDFTYNEGGTLSIGATGTSRNGRTCLEIFRQTCIIHIYIRRKKDPCAPGYWMDFRRCLLPSDLSHKIRR